MDLHGDVDGVQRREDIGVEVRARRAPASGIVRPWPSLTRSQSWARKSKTISTSRSPEGIGPVVSPRRAGAA